MDFNFPDVVLRPGGGRRCRVLYSYSPQNDDELRLQVNDEIDFLSEVEDGWWKGKLGNKIGVFPSNFVCELSNEESCHTSEGDVSAPLSSPDSGATLDDAPLLPPKPVKETCRVLFAYEAVNDDELTLKKDDVITIITKEVGDKGWWKGEIRGKIGLFPDNFVELVIPPPAAAATTAEEALKKPDRPTKSFDRGIESKIPHVTSGSIFHHHVSAAAAAAAKDQDEKMVAGLRTDGSIGKKNHHGSDRIKSDSPPVKSFPDKCSGNTVPVKADTSASHRKSSEVKTAAGKKPVLPPPLTAKPKPAAVKPGGSSSSSNNVKRLSEEISDLMESTASNKSPGIHLKRLSGDFHDLIDGAMSSKLGCLGHHSTGGVKDEFDLDAVERNVMLTHITSSRPRPPGRRLPTKEPKETESQSPLTNGNVEMAEKEKVQKEREWEKNKPPWVNELKLNLRSSKTSPTESKFDKKSSVSGQIKSASQSPIDLGESAAVGSAAANVSSRQFSPQSEFVPRVPTRFETGSKVLDMFSRFASVEKPKSPVSAGPLKSSEFNCTEIQNDDVLVSRKEFADLKSKVEKLEKLVAELAGRLNEEVDKRKLVEKELIKLTDLVTQV